MGNLPVIQELGTGFQALGDHVTGNPEKARERWDNYYHESVVGSAWAGAVERSKGNEDKAKEYFRGFKRATGKAIFGGGLLRDFPVFHELAVSGESLGDIISSGDTAAARTRWKMYLESSVIGGSLGTVAATVSGDKQRAQKLGRGFVKAGLRFGVAGISLGATASTAGAAALYGVASTATGAVVGVLTGAASTAATQVIDEGEVHDPSAVIGNGLFGGALLWANGAATGLCANNAAGVFPRSPQQDTEVFEIFPSNDDAATSLIPIIDLHGTRDVVIIIDGSASVQSGDFDDVKTALGHLMTSVNQKLVDTKYAAITFSDTATQVSFPFLPCDEAAEKIENIPYPDGSTNDQSALTEAKKLFDNPSFGGRVNATKVVFLVMTAYSDLKQHLSKAIELKRLGVQIFLFAVGTCIKDGIKDMLSVVSYPPEKFLHRVKSFRAFLLIIEMVVERICPGKFIEKAIQKVPEPEETVEKIGFMISIRIDLRRPGKPSLPEPKIKRDVVVIMDGSGSIPSDQFQKGNQAIKHLIEMEEESEHDTRFAAVTYSDSASVKFSFLSLEEAGNKILKIHHPGGQTNTQAALVEARKLFEDPGKSSGGRADAKKVIYLVTDGQSNVHQDRTIPEAEALKKIGVEIFVVAVGSYIQGIEEMVHVASLPPQKFVCRVENHAGFLEIVKLALKQVAPAKYAVDDGHRSN
ncbi:cartilage matrix protein-like [Montipora foliosa]|uniref:cartilage matrix protein-like n=1 Tax=Montipora foliosa TaxID=591990 RepID=UPI0035F1A54C